jgi:hypothetical protein
MEVIVGPRGLHVNPHIESFFLLTCSPPGSTLPDMARPRKEADRTHSSALRIRLLPEHDALVREAATLAGVSLSDWLRERIIRAARKEVAEAARYGAAGKSSGDQPE